MSTQPYSVRVEEAVIVEVNGPLSKDQAAGLAKELADAVSPPASPEQTPPPPPA